MRFGVRLRKKGLNDCAPGRYLDTEFVGICRKELG